MKLTLVCQVEKRRIRRRIGADWVVLHKERKYDVKRMTDKRVHTALAKFDRRTGKEILRQDERIGRAYITTGLRVEREDGSVVWTFDNGYQK